MNLTQERWVVNHLRKHGEISRNYCLKNYISRLSAYIYDLRKVGWEFVPSRRKGDYVYKVSKML